MCMERHIEAVVTNTNGILFKCTKALLQQNDFCYFIELIPLFAASNCTVGKKKKKLGDVGGGGGDGGD